jgi:hypothetical protein
MSRATVAARNNADLLELGKNSTTELSAASGSMVNSWLGSTKESSILTSPAGVTAEFVQLSRVLAPVTGRFELTELF